MWLMSFDRGAHKAFLSVVWGVVWAVFAQGCVFDPVADVGEGEAGVIDASGDSGLDARVDASVDADGLVDGESPDGGCTEGFHRCSDDGSSVLVCRDGGWSVAERCDLGCREVPVECRSVVASNGIDQQVNGSQASDWIITGDVMADSDVGTHSDNGTLQFGVVPQSDCGSETVSIGVFVVKDLIIEHGARLRFRGHNAVAIRVLGRVEIHGVIDVSGGRGACVDDAVPLCSGPGGFPGGGRSDFGDAQDGQGPGAGHAGNILGSNPTGGGGGGHLGNGGSGGDDTTDLIGAEGGEGGTSYGSAVLVPLCGGSGGGSGALELDIDAPPWDPAFGGGGGGAIQITANENIVISCESGEECGIRATGGGGQADHQVDYTAAGGGGGAGGAILLEAVSVSLDNARLSVAGGGGAGGYNSGSECNDGQDGPLDSGRAEGGQGALAGGAGGGGDVPSGGVDGLDGEDGRSGATGGGGGAAGRIVVNVANPSAFSSGGIFNPGESIPGALVVGTVAAE